MKINELRVSNLVYPNEENATPYKVMQIFEESVLFYQSEKVYEDDVIIGCDDLIPIPLTEEWLIKFGFEKIICDEHPFIHFIIKGIFRIDFHPNNGFEFNCYGHPYDQYVEENFFSFKALHIHQLQNLFYALTGEELKTTL